MDSLYTNSTSKSTMDVEPIVVRQTSTTRLLFYPIWVSDSSNPLRGGFVFQRKSKNDEWKDVDSKKLTTLKKDEQYKLNLTGKDITNLLSNLSQIQRALNKVGYQQGTNFVKLDKDNSHGIFLQIGNTSNKKFVIEQLKKLENDNFQNIGSVVIVARLERIIDEFEKNMTNSDEKFWQTFFEREENVWIFQQLFSMPITYLNGETYLGGKNTRGRGGQGGVVTDFLLKNGSNGSFAVVEIKTPTIDLIGNVYRKTYSVNNGQNETYSIHQDLTGAVVQMENQIYTAIKYFQNKIGDDYDINLLEPRGVLIAGNLSNITDSSKRKSFHLFRKTIGKNQIITFDEILEKLRSLKSLYNN